MQKSKPKDNHEVSADSPIRLRLAPRPQTKGQSSPPRRGPLAEALSPRPRPARPRTGYQFSDSPETGLGTSSPPSRQTPLTKRHVQLMRSTTPATSAARWRSTGRVTDGTGDRVQQELPATVLITVLPTDTRSVLCYLTPAPRTKRRGRSSPGPCSLSNSRRAQLLVIHLVRDPPAGPRTYCSFSASAEARLVPHPRRPRPQPLQT